MWSRRKFLAALGSSSTAALAGVWASGCTGPKRRIASTAALPIDTQDYHLAFQHLASSLEEPFVWSKKEQIDIRSTDPDESRFDVELNSWVALGGTIDGVRHQVLLNNPTAEKLANAAQGLGAKGNRGDLAIKLPPLKSQLLLSPAALVQARNALDARALAELYGQAEKFADSRIIFRSAYSRFYLSRTRLITHEKHLQREQSRSVRGVLIAAWTGKDVTTSRAEEANAGLPMRARFSDELLGRRTKEVLAHLHARSAPEARVSPLILSPACSAQLLLDGIALACEPRSRNLVLNEVAIAETDRLVVKDTPNSGYAAFEFDDLGDTARPRHLVGTTPVPLGQGNWRRDHNARLRCLPSNLRLEPADLSKQTTPNQLLAGMERGVILDGPLHCALDPERERFVLRASIGYEVRRGQLSGRVFSGLTVRSTINDFVSRSEGIANAPETFTAERHGLPISLSCPHWRSTAHVEGA
ncbi:MAG: hypothetical protein JKY56_12170 [Kofleriaceae bacterium]|nr:hypothetical protein [Kofleriaceae bacterium]